MSILVQNLIIDKLYYFTDTLTPGSRGFRPCVAASHPLDGPPIEPRAQVRSRQARAHPARAGRDHAQRDRTIAWLLLLLKEQRGAR